MPTVPISMRKLKEILRLKYGVGLSHRQIGRSLAISPSVVSRYANRAAQLGIKQWPLPTGWDDTKLKHAFLQTQVKMKKHSLPDWATVHRELRNKCVTLQLLWEEYCERNPEPPPVSRSCWRTQTRRVSGVQPIFGAMEQIVAHCESYSP